MVWCDRETKLIALILFIFMSFLDNFVALFPRLFCWTENRIIAFIHDLFIQLSLFLYLDC